MPDTRIAIVGMACLLPGASTPDEFWRGLRAGADHRTEGGPEVFGTSPAVPGGWGDEAHQITATRGGFVRNEPEFDLTGLALPAAELAGLDRVVRWPLGVAGAALADAGLTGSAALHRTGLVLGNYSFPTASSVRLCVPLIQRAVSEGLGRAGLAAPPGPAGPAGGGATGFGDGVDPRNLWPSGLPATTVATALRLGGPRLALDAACSSTLYGVALARDYLLTGAADVMLAGAVCVPDPLLIHLCFSDLNAYPRNGFSQPFDARSSGIVTGQGAGIFVLKRLADALADGDRVHAVIDSIGLTNDGAGRHLLSPNVSGQLDAYAQAYQGLDPSTVDYIECHATGTPLGDATELRGLHEFFGAGAGAVPPLGSVKGNVGHLLTAAGFTSLLKVILAIRHGVIPPTVGVGEPLPAASAAVVRSERPWPDVAGRPRRAAVSAFGFGGTNAHLVLSAPELASGAAAPRERAVVPGQPVASAGAASHQPVAMRAQLAITGVGIRIGAVSGAAELMAAARTAKPALRPLPPQRWYGLGADGQPAGYAESAQLDVRTYRIPPAELTNANPQHLVLFEAAEQALADAGYPAPPPGTRADQLPPRRVAVVVAVEAEPRSHTHRARFDIGAYVRAECARTGTVLDEASMAALEHAVRGAVHEDIGANEVLSYIGNVMASRVSSSRNLTGPSFTISTDATAGARAIELAGLLLRDESIEAVLIGGVDLAAGVENTLARAALAGLAGAEVPPLGDGAAAVVLTRPDAARRSYAVIDTLCLAGPQTSAAAVAGAAMAAAGVAPSDVGYLELAGTSAAELAAGYPAGDGAEPHSCVLGGLAELVGDIQHASVLAAVVKAALCLHRAELPASPAGLAAAGESPLFTLLGEPQPWLRRRREQPRTAAVAAADPVTGGSAHLVLREAATTPAASAEPVRVVDAGVLVLPLRAGDGAGLAAAAAEQLAALRGGADPARLCATAVHGAQAVQGPDGLAGRLTAVLVATDAARLERELTAAERDLPRVVAEGGDWATPAGSFCTARPIGAGKVAFVYPGAFTTYPGAGRELFRLFPSLRERFEAAADRPWERYKHGALYPRAAGRVDRRALMRHEGELVENIPAMLATGTNLAVLHTQMLRDVLGVRPQGGFGYSLGESSMLFAMGVWDDTARDDAALAASPLFRDRLRGPKHLVRELWGLPATTPDSGVWSTHLLLADEASVRAAMAGLPRVFLTHVNTPGEVVVAGEPASCAALIERVGCQSAKAPANHVMHVPIVDSERAALAELNSYPLGAPAAGLELLTAYDYGTVDVTDRRAIAERIAWTLRSTIDFARLARTAHERGFRYFVEVGPGATCTRWITETLAGSPHVAVSVDRRGAPLGQTIAQVLARLASHGLPVDLALLQDAEAAAGAGAPRRMTLPVTIGGESIADRVAAATQTLGVFAGSSARVGRPAPACSPVGEPELAVSATAAGSAAPAVAVSIPQPRVAAEAVAAVPAMAAASALAATPAAARPSARSLSTAPARPVPPLTALPAARLPAAPVLPASPATRHPDPEPSTPSEVTAMTEFELPALAGDFTADTITVEGDPFVFLPPAVATLPPPSPAHDAPRPAASSLPAVSPVPVPVLPLANPAAIPVALRRPSLPAPAGGRDPLRAIAASVAQSHRAVLATHDAIQRTALLALESGRGPVAAHQPANSATRTGGHAGANRPTRAHEPADTPARTGGHAGGGAGGGAGAAPAVAAETADTRVRISGHAERRAKPAGVVWDEDELLEFATGQIANVFGPAFAEIDGYAARVRLPEPPYHFVTRVTSLDGTTGRYEPSKITTEYDIPHGAWYSVDGLTPCAVTIEAGQCDLLLISYLGIDFKNKGERVYRLLDSRLVFHGALPRAGQTLRYDINIDRFVWNGDTLLFFFNYKCYADGELILELLDACAGFFNSAELEDSLGVVFSEADRRRRAALTPAWFKPLARTEKNALDAADLAKLSEGRRAEVFGPTYEQGDGINPSIKLPGEMLRMIDEITSIDRLGGPRRLGELTAVKNLDPDGWYFRCHFTGDPVLAGSLVAEGGVQLLQTYAMYLGMHLVFPDAEFQSVPGLQTEVKVRGQITPKTRNIRYHAEITDLQMLPRPTVIADIIVYDGDKPMISMRNFGMQVREKPGTQYRPEAGGLPAYLGRRNKYGEAAFINELHLAHAAKGDLATAMGPEFGIYAAEGRRAPYIPNGDFQFVDRIMRLDGTRMRLKPGAKMATEYDTPPEAWYYRENAFTGMPNCVYMETSLQAAILLGYYLGATLASPDENLAIRNLDGHATVTRQLDLRGKTIRHESEMLSSQAVPGATLQNFRYQLTADGEPFYEGESLFGYFSDEALSNQVGLDAGRYVAPWLETEGRRASANVRTLKVRSDDRWFDPDKPLRLGDGHLRLVDEVDVVTGGGEHGKGYLFGRRVIDPADWYFNCHFYRDPVMPGSLGVEAIIQALQLYVIDNGLVDGIRNPRFDMPLDVRMGWRYRGQILRTDREMSFDAHVKEVRREDGRLVVIADASLWKPNLRIYHLTDIAVEVREGTP